MEETMNHLFGKMPDVIWNLILLGISVIVGLLIKYLLKFIFRHQAKEKEAGFSFLYVFFKRLGKPFNYFLPLLTLVFLMPLMRLSVRWQSVLQKIVEIGLIISFASILIGSIKILEDYVYHTYDLKKADNIKERKVKTQLQFIRKIAIGIIIILTVSAILLSFDGLRKIGAGVLTGVGVSGIIIGFAAQKSIANLLAGFQIAFTQPIRIDDVLVVEGEWGRVEEITLTYVVVAIWDDRRLILPINYFIEKPFQNWTRNSAAILGTVFLYVDYTIPVDAIRKEFTRLLTGNPLWDERVAVVQVTDFKEKTMEVRLLISAADSGKAFDLRCFLRENIIGFLQKNYPECLPATRVVLTKEINTEKSS